MEKKSLLQYFREEAGTYQRLAERVVKILAENRIYTIDLLMAKTPEELFAIKGIGDAAMNLISKVMTKEEAERQNRKDIYDKHCHECEPTCLREWFQKAGTTYLHACQMEKILRNNGVRTIDMFMHMTFGDYGLMHGIGEKRLVLIAKTKKLIEQSRKQK